MQQSIRARSVAGALTPPLFVAVLLALTVSERAFLRREGWSAVHRTTVEWPSLLSLGHYGWVMIVTFVVAGIGGVALASAMWSGSVVPAERVQAALVAVMSAAIALEAFRPDSPRATGVASWHDVVHNAVFPAIPIASLAAVATAVYTARQVARPYVGCKPSLLLLAVMAAGLGLTSVDSIAQLARYFYFGALLIWIELLALGAFNRSRGALSTEVSMTRGSS